MNIKDFEKEARRKSEVTKGAFHLTKTFENLETAANGTEISRKGFQKSHARRLVKTFENLETTVNGTEISRKGVQKSQKLLNFRNANHSTENSRSS